MSAREQILGRLRQRKAAVPASEQPDFSVLTRRQWSAGERLDLFRQQIESVHGEVMRVPREDWLTPLVGWLQQREISTLLAPRQHEVGQTLRAGWTAATGNKGPELRAYDRPIEAWKPELFSEVDAALTSTLGGIAETGSLVLWPDADQPRLMSLVPPIHIAVLDADRIYSNWLELLREQDWAAGMPANALLISGPSKTADIEQTLAYGVHGPAELLVLVRQ
ncbi:lactate utilization protein C [Natronospirillum operosum]|uniref:Lactate utilization protein C n=1 Tax=Natronospirillum operosum TaxID=2759953 RepID=A0A4Z0WG37_9GAMM|nr:lactate utilization protein C [Natronospirillum operosum]TGG94186.1 lactate utilization protein C [Natronospirillum operosum]